MVRRALLVARRRLRRDACRWPRTTTSGCGWRASPDWRTSPRCWWCAGCCPGRVSATREDDRLRAEARVRWRGGRDRRTTLRGARCSRCGRRLALALPRPPGRPGGGSAPAHDGRAPPDPAGSRLHAAGRRPAARARADAPDCARRGWRFDRGGSARRRPVRAVRCRIATAVVEARTDRLSPLTRAAARPADSPPRRAASCTRTARAPACTAGWRPAWPACRPFTRSTVCTTSGTAALGRAAYLALERRLAGWTRVIVNVSRAQEDEGLALGLFRPGQSRVIVNGVDVGAAGRARARPLGRARRAAAWTRPRRRGRHRRALRPVKRLDVLVRATARARPAATLGLIGAGPRRPGSARLAGELGLGARVVFAGEVAEAARCFAAFDVFAAPSRKEGLPLAVCSRPWRSGCPWWPATSRRTARCSGRSRRAWWRHARGVRARIGALLSDPDQRGRLGAENRTRARSEFDVRSMLDALEGVYREALGL